MSQENVEVVQASFDAWNAGDMDRWVTFLTPDVTWRPPPDWPEPGPFTGSEAVRQAFQNRETWDTDVAEPIGEFIHVADRVVVRFVWRGRGHGPETNMETSLIFTMRKGKISGFAFFWDHTEALASVGLSE